MYYGNISNHKFENFYKNKNGFQIIESNVKPTDSYLLLNIVIFLLELLLNAKIL